MLALAAASGGCMVST